jgi:hypothetical protein
VGVDHVRVERDAGQGQRPATAGTEAAEGDAGARQIISGDLVVGADVDGTPGIPKESEIAATVGSQIDEGDGRVDRGRERGADLKHPGHVVLTLRIEDQCPALQRGPIKRIHAWRQRLAAEVNGAHVGVGSHAGEADRSGDKVEPGLAGDGTGRDDRAVDDHGRRKPGDPGSSAR